MMEQTFIDRSINISECIKTLRISSILWVFIFIISIQYSCTKTEVTKDVIQVLNATADGLVLTDNTINVSLDPILVLQFSKALNTTNFESAFSLRASGADINAGFQYFAGGTAVEISLSSLEADQQYQLSVDASISIGQNSEVLENDYVINFTTRSDGIIETISPCLSANNNCSYSFRPDPSQSSFINLFSSYPVFDPLYKLDDIQHLVIVLHGQNRDADVYFNNFMNTLRNLGLEDNTLLIAPLFNEVGSAQQNELYWNGNQWREGALSSNPNMRISSFEILNGLIDQILNSTSFNALKNVVISGHSSGATMTHLYSGILDPDTYPELSFYFDVHNSQYFYYPEDLRWNESINGFDQPSGCSNYNHWPYGYVNTNEYLNTIAQTDFNDRFISNRVNYILGSSDLVTTGTLNTGDCAAVLLGQHRFDRGNKMYEFMVEQYEQTHGHMRVQVDNVGHNANLMFNSSEYRIHLSSILN